MFLVMQRSRSQSCLICKLPKVLINNSELSFCNFQPRTSCPHRPRPHNEQGTWCHMIKCPPRSIIPASVCVWIFVVYPLGLVTVNSWWYLLVARGSGALTLYYPQMRGDVMRAQGSSIPDTMLPEVTTCLTEDKTHSIMSRLIKKKLVFLVTRRPS